MMSPDCVYPWLSAGQLEEKAAKELPAPSVPGAAVKDGSSFAMERGPVPNPMDPDKNWNE